MPESLTTLRALHKVDANGSIASNAKGTVDVGPLLHCVDVEGHSVEVYEHATAFGEGYKVYFLPSEGTVADSIIKMERHLQAPQSRLRTQKKPGRGDSSGAVRICPAQSEEAARTALGGLTKQKAMPPSAAFAALLYVLEQTCLPQDRSRRNSTNEGHSILFGAGSRKRCATNVLAGGSLQRPHLWSLIHHVLQCAIKHCPALENFKFFTSVFVSEGILTRYLTSCLGC